jgi:hypothetical protein
VKYYNKDTFHQSFIELCIFVAAFVAITFICNWQITDSLFNLIMIIIFIIIGCIDGLISVHNIRYKIPEFIWGFMFGWIVSWLT